MDEKEINEYIGKRLSQIRHLKGLSQRQLGVTLGVSCQQVQKYEKGKNRLSGGKLYLSACYLEVSPLVFFEGLPDVAITNPLLTREQQEVLWYFAQIDSLKARKSTIELIKAIAAPKPKTGK